MSFTKLIEEAAERQKKRYEEQKVVSAKLSSELTQLFLDVPDLEKIIVRGYTPGFNDGDPCYHSQYEPNYIIKNDEWIKCSEDNDDDCYDEDDTECTTLGFLADNMSIPNDVVVKLEVVDGLLNSADDLFEEMFGTNWELVFTLNEKTNEIEVDHSSYHCDY